MSGPLGSWPERPLHDGDLARLRDHEAVRYAQGARWAFNVDWDRDWATGIVVVTRSRVVGLEYRQGEGWGVEFADAAEPGEDPDLLFMVAVEAMGYTDLPDC